MEIVRTIQTTVTTTARIEINDDFVRGLNKELAHHWADPSEAPVITVADVSVVADDELELIEQKPTLTKIVPYKGEVNPTSTYRVADFISDYINDTLWEAPRKVEDESDEYSEDETRYAPFEKAKLRRALRIKHQYGHCPCCGSDENVECTDIVTYDEMIKEKWYCIDCNESWTEFFQRIYDGAVHDDNEYDKDGDPV